MHAAGGHDLDHVGARRELCGGGGPNGCGICRVPADEVAVASRFGDHPTRREDPRTGDDAVGDRLSQRKHDLVWITQVAHGRGPAPQGGERVAGCPQRQPLGRGQFLDQRGDWCCVGTPAQVNVTVHQPGQQRLARQIQRWNVPDSIPNDVGSAGQDSIPVEEDPTGSSIAMRIAVDQEGVQQRPAVCIVHTSHYADPMTSAEPQERSDMLETDAQRAHLAQVAALAGLELDSIELPRDRYADAQGLRLHYLEWGDAAAYPIILLHGGALTAHTWDVVCLGLLPDYRCIVPDLRGHGDTDWAPDGDYSLDAFRRDLELLLAHLGIDRCILIGNSLGGMTAARFTAERAAADQPEALVLVDVGPEMREAGRQRLRGFTGGPREMDTVEDFVERAMAFNPLRRRDVLRRSLLHNLRQLPSGKWTWKYDPNRFGQPPASGRAQTVGSPLERRTAHRLPDAGRPRRPQRFVPRRGCRAARRRPRERALGPDRGGQSHGPGRPTLALVNAVRGFLSSLGLLRAGDR